MILEPTADERASSPYWLLIRAERLRVVNGCLRRLAEKQRCVLTLRYGREMSFTEIAAVWGVSKVAVHRMHSRALRRLAAALAERGITRPSDLL
jgi:RNA polymerase sigma factor for flagellar operon FliA